MVFILSLYRKVEYTLVFSYLGYSKKEIEVNLSENQRLNVELTEGVDY